MTGRDGGEGPGVLSDLQDRGRARLPTTELSHSKCQ